MGWMHEYATNLDRELWEKCFYLFFALYIDYASFMELGAEFQTLFESSILMIFLDGLINTYQIYERSTFMVR